MINSKLLALKTPDYDIPENLGWITSNFEFGSLTKPADIINNLLPFIFVFAGIILFAMLISGGFTIFLSAGDPKQTQKGTKTITNALIGFFIIFAAHWIIQIIEFTFGIRVL